MIPVDILYVTYVCPVAGSNSCNLRHRLWQQQPLLHNIGRLQSAIASQPNMSCNGDRHVCTELMVKSQLGMQNPKVWWVKSITLIG